ncbi:hypothetical protein D104_03790 [Marinomonas profundimaris]|uniref:Uncharacterized protein n=1 Tax=Marinomonas profundimaris TaxID=1208321 RepID=W1RX92_9GAMM|nr:hypothetical protein D104_03790 [Marinomonas profundimaris]
MKQAVKELAQFFEQRIAFNVAILKTTRHTLIYP